MPTNVIDLCRVAVHELGHMIGIPHLSVGNLMAPTYSTGIATLQGGDIAEAVSRYGPPVNPPTPVPPPGDWKVTITGKGEKPDVKVE